MSNFRYEEINSHLYRIYDALGVAMYLAVGHDRAALIDTGYGLTGLREQVESLTKLPVAVLLTHGHLDHALGIYEFDEIYMHPADQDTYAIHSAPDFRQRFFDNQGTNVDSYAFQLARPVNFLPVTDGQVFDLGGLHIKAYHTPGHTKGMTMYLFVEDRMMLFGDGCGPNTMIMEDCSGTIGEYYKSLETVKAHEQEYDRVLRNHGTCESPKELLDNVMEVCRRILAGTDDHILLPEQMQTMFVSKLDPVPLSYSARAVKMTENGLIYADGFGEGNVNYRQDKVQAADKE